MVILPFEDLNLFRISRFEFSEIVEPALPSPSSFDVRRRQAAKKAERVSLADIYDAVESPSVILVNERKALKECHVSLQYEEHHEPRGPEHQAGRQKTPDRHHPGPTRPQSVRSGQGDSFQTLIGNARFHFRQLSQSGVVRFPRRPPVTEC